jgi:hypothetical protein
MTVAKTTGAASHELQSASAANAYREGGFSTLNCRVPHGAFERLERYELKGSRTVLRGLKRSNALRLPDPSQEFFGVRGVASCSALQHRLRQRL